MATTSTNDNTQNAQVKKQQNFDPQQKQYLYLSKKGRQKYMEISKHAYQTMLMWSGVGITGGYTIYKFQPYVKFLRRYPNFGKTMFIACSVMFTYHGYKLMNYLKRKGQRDLSKNPQYQLTREQYEIQLKEGLNKKD